MVQNYKYGFSGQKFLILGIYYCDQLQCYILVKPYARSDRQIRIGADSHTSTVGEDKNALGLVVHLFKVEEESFDSGLASAWLINQAPT